MAIKLLNQYKASYASLNQRSVVASSMKDALDSLLDSEDSAEPVSIVKTVSDISVAVPSTTVAMTTSTVTEDGEPVADAAVYPTSLPALQRGTTVWLTSVPPEGYTLNRWEVNGTPIGTSNPIQLTVPKDEEVTALACVAVYASPAKPADVTNLAVTSARVSNVLSITATWTLPEEPVDQLVASLYLGDELIDATTLLSNITSATWTSTDFDLALASQYTVKVRTVYDDVSSDGVSLDTTTPASVPEVTALTLTPTSDSIEAAWTSPALDTLDSYTLRLYKGIMVVSTATSVRGTTYTFSGLDADTEYSVKVTVVDTNGNTSDGVTSTATTEA